MLRCSAPILLHSIPNMRLLNSQKLDLFNTIKSANFEPFQFEITGDDNEKGPAVLRLSKTDLRCEFTSKWIPANPAFTHYTMQFIPGNNEWESTISIAYWDSPLLKHIQNWLQRVRREISTPDPWAILSVATLPDSTASEETINIPFSYTEWEHVRKGVDDIKKLLLDSVKDSKEGESYVIQTLDKLIEDGKHFGRKDWFNQAVGALVGVMVTIGCSPEVTRSVWEMLKTTVAGIVHLTPVLADGIKHLS